MSTASRRSGNARNGALSVTVVERRPVSEPLWWPAIGTIVFVLTVPGTVVGVGPFLLSRWQIAPPFFGWPLVRWLGGVLIVCAAPIFVDFVVRFARQGRGTPAPVAPPRHLVVGGGFRYVRNPGYIAVVSLLLGQALLFGSTRLVWYAAAVALAFHAFVVLYEEPTLRRQFGAEYEAYCRAVPRWFPRLPTRHHAAQ
jgi:protein-S-isoprenylcysteine O-methyltransferase Ste14